MFLIIKIIMGDWMHNYVVFCNN